jgi:hypothetical protein
MNRLRSKGEGEGEVMNSIQGEAILTSEVW